MSPPLFLFFKANYRDRPGYILRSGPKGKRRWMNNRGLTVVTIKANRVPWRHDFPVVEIAADILTVHGHPAYLAAKRGDLSAALSLANTFLTKPLWQRLHAQYGRLRPLLAGVHAVEGAGVNMIPLAMTAWLADQSGFEVDRTLVQINRVGHTKASGWHRLAFPALFSGAVQPGRAYVLVDDFIGQGGTLANLKGFIERRGGSIVGAVALTGKPHSSILALTRDTLEDLRSKHGHLEPWWKQRYGFGFDALTESEARYLLRAEDVDTIRSRLAAAEQAGNP